MAQANIGGVRSEAVERAQVAWQSLRDRFEAGHGNRAVIRDRRRRRASLWPLSQVIHASALLGPLGVAPGSFTRLVDGLRRFETDRGWTATPWPWPGRTRRLYYDDNAWLGLAAAQSWLMSGVDASHALAVCAEQVARAGDSAAGGVRWNEHTGARHACSTAPTVVLTLRLARGRTAATAELSPEVAAFVQRSLEFLDVTLARPDGLVADHITADGVVNDHVWSYNQGSTIGAHLLAWQVLGRDEHFERAQWLAAAAVDYLTVGDRLWREPPAFVAIFLRQLMALDAHAATHRWQGLIDRYIDRVWLEGRDKRTGLFTAGGIGSYDEGVVIDQAAIVQLCALQAMPAEWRRLAC